MKGEVTIQSESLNKTISLTLLGEILLSFGVLLISIHTLWISLWSISEKIRLFIKNKRTSESMSAILKSFSAIQNGSYDEAQNILLKTRDSQPLSALLQAYAAQKANDWGKLEEYSSILLKTPTTKEIGLQYKFSYFEHFEKNEDAIDTLQELIAKHSNIMKNIIIKKIFLQYVGLAKKGKFQEENKNYYAYALKNLSKEHIAILFTTQANSLYTLQKKNNSQIIDLYKKAYDYDPFNIEAICWLAKNCNNFITVKTLLKIFKKNPNRVIAKTLLTMLARETLIERFTMLKEQCVEHLSNPSKNPEVFYSLCKAAIMAGLNGEAQFYLSELFNLYYTSSTINAEFLNLQTEIQKLQNEEPNKIINSLENAIKNYKKETFECSFCHAGHDLFSQYCSKCGTLKSLHAI